MNRRQSLRTLALGSIGAASPLGSWQAPASVSYEQKENNKTDKKESASELSYAPAGHNAITLVAGKHFIQRFLDYLPAFFNVAEYETLDNAVLLQKLANGESMIWIGPPDKLPKDLSLGAFRPSASMLSVRAAHNSPFMLDGLQWKKAMVSSAYIAPPKEMPYHNIDEEVRADFLPILEAVDRFGNLVGYPGILMSYYAPSLACGRFKGCKCFCFFVDEPLQLLSDNEWKRLFKTIGQHCESGLQVFSFDTHYALYKPGERVQARTRIQNSRRHAVSVVLRYSIKSPFSQTFAPVTEMRRVAEGGSDTLSLCDLLPGTQEGMWVLRMEVLQDVELAEKLALTGSPQVVERREIGFMISSSVSTPKIMEFNGPGIVIDGKEGFWAGTHYYPSTSWWEWVWRDFQPLKAASDLAAIRCAGYRIVRIWIDPVIDEPVLRAMDAIILIAAQNGIVLDICVFTQWVRQMGFERETGEQVLFEFRHPKDFNIVSFSLRHLDLQREYVTVISKRWKNAGNIFYNIANEVFVKDPDATQMDKEVREWKDIPETKGTRRDTLLFRRWAMEMEKAIRAAGGSQPVIPGYMFSTLKGGDVYLGNADAPLVPWHSYLPVEQTALTLQYFDAVSSGRPVLLEEFGALGWNNVTNYDSNSHYALAGGAAAAMSYEWGISWLSRESCYWPLPLLEAGVEDPDPRWFSPYIELRKIWSDTGVGMCATPSGTGYGSVYHGTPFPAEAAIALGRLGLMGEGLQRVVYHERVYVIIPEADNDALEAVQKTLKELWLEGVLFGIWQEADINTLPATAKAVICPAPLSSLSALKHKGIEVYTGEDWKKSRIPEKTSVSHGINALVRRTGTGTLFTLVAPQPAAKVSLQYEQSHVSIGIEDFGLVLLSEKGVTMLEGKGEMMIDRTLFCSSREGRLIIASEEGLPLLRSDNFRLMTTAPGAITFRRNIASVSVSDGSHRKPVRVGNSCFKGNTLQADDQLMKYVIHVTLK